MLRLLQKMKTPHTAREVTADSSTPRKKKAIAIPATPLLEILVAVLVGILVGVLLGILAGALLGTETATGRTGAPMPRSMV